MPVTDPHQSFLLYTSSYSGIIVGLGDGLGSGHGTVGSAGDGHGVGAIVGDGFGSDGFGLVVGDAVGETLGVRPGVGETVGSVVRDKLLDVDPSPNTADTMIPENKNENATADITNFLSTFDLLDRGMPRVGGRR